VRAQKETNTNRLHDTGLELGARSKGSFSFRAQIANLAAIKDTNALANTKVEASQSVLNNIAATAQGFIDALIAGRDSAGNQSLLAGQADANIEALTASLNSSNGGASLFSGINSANRPVADYDAGSPAKTALATAFTGTFGFSQTNAAARNISPDAMQNFLAGAYDGLFNAAGWTASWSSASNTVAASVIAPGEKAVTAVSANESAFRQLMSAYVMVSDLGAGNLSPETFNKILDRAVTTASDAVNGITALQARLGTAQASIRAADERLAAQASVMRNEVDIAEGVDAYEAASRVTQLESQLQVAYTLTGRLAKLSLLNFID
jgi:flagellar hook-associated protein 3 FlgL